jgi:YVTN family beta-propeller protein
MAVEIYSTDTDSGQISVIRREPTGYRTVKEIAVGNAPRGGVKFTGDGRGFVSNTSTNTVSEIDALTHREVARIQVGSGPRGLGIVPGERYLLVSNSGSNTVSVVDLESREELSQVAVGRDPRHMAINAAGTAAYVCVWGSGYIAKLDISALAQGNHRSVREVKRITIDRNAFPYSLSIDRSGRFAVVACNAVKYVPIIDLETDEIVARVQVKNDGARAVAFSPDNRFAIVSLEREAAVAVIDMESREVTRYIPVGPGPRGIAVDQDAFTFYVTAFSRDTVGFADVPSMPHSLTVVHLDGVDLGQEGPMPRFEEIPVGFGPCSVALFDSERAGYRSDKVDVAVRRLSDPVAAG